MSKLDPAEKTRIRGKIRIAMQDNNFTLNSFAEKNRMDRRTVKRVIDDNDKLSADYKKYCKKQMKAKQAEQETKIRIKQETKAKQNSGAEPFVREVKKNFAEGKGVGTVTTRSLDIKTVEDLLSISEVDMDIWEVDRHEINSWEVTVGGRNTGTGDCETFTNFQVKVWFKRKHPEILAVEELLEQMKVASPIVSKIKIRPIRSKGGHNRELEISLADIHFGLRCFKPAADIDWSPEQAAVMTMAMLEKLLLLSRSFGPFERIVFPMGHDFLHSDNVYNTTTAGTVQPEADAWQNTFLKGEELAFAIVERMREEAPVKVISVPGNHSRHSEIALSRVLNARYHNNENVEVDASLSPFKFHLYGVNLIGFEHGHSIRQTVRLAALMANECRLNGWQQARFCEFHLGDQHRKGSGKPSMFEEQGVSVEYMPGLTPANEWHRIHSYNWQKRAGLGFVWDKSAGPISRLQVNIDNYSGKIMG